MTSCFTDQSGGAASSALLLNVNTTMWNVSGEVVLKQVTIHCNVGVYLNVMLLTLMGCSGCFISYNSHYLKHSGSKPGTLRWMTMIQRSCQEPRAFEAACTSSTRQHNTDLYIAPSVSRWAAKLPSSFQYLAKHEIWPPCWT